MKPSSLSDIGNSTRSVQRKGPDWTLRITPGLEFNGRAVRARAGLINLLIACVITLQLLAPESAMAACILAFLLVDMIAAVFFGPVPFSPMGVLASLLVRAYEPQWTPHLPKRFAWSMGAMLAAACMVLQLLGWSAPWLFGLLGLFYVLTWLDAALGFCVGCWIYSKCFGCEVCRLG